MVHNAVGERVVTEEQSPNNLTIDGMLQHILNLRQVVHVDNDVNAEHGRDRNEMLLAQRLQRELEAPTWAHDYVV